MTGDAFGHCTQPCTYTAHIACTCRIIRHEIRSPLCECVRSCAVFVVLPGFHVSYMYYIALWPWWSDENVGCSTGFHEKLKKRVNKPPAAGACEGAARLGCKNGKARARAPKKNPQMYLRFGQRFVFTRAGGLLYHQTHTVKNARPLARAHIYCFVFFIDADLYAILVFHFGLSALIRRRALASVWV